MMLLMGMKINLTKNPTKPMTTNPIAVRNATFVNSTRLKTNNTVETAPFLLIKKKIKEIVSTFAIGLVATLNETDAVFGEISQWIEH